MTTPPPKYETKPIHLVLKGGAIAPEPSPLAMHVSRLATAIDSAAGDPGAKAAARVAAGVLADFVALMASLDEQYGAGARLPLADAAAAADAALRSSAELESWMDRLAIAETPALNAVQLAIGYWSMCHDLPIGVPEPLVNALAGQANRSESRQQAAAVYAMMQGVVAHLAPTLKSDLERSNPERPWRLVNLNLAITAIRTGDEAMMRNAFDTLNENLPDERAGFYAEALQMASQPGFPEASRALIEAELARWTSRH